MLRFGPGGALCGRFDYICCPKNVVCLKTVAGREKGGERDGKEGYIEREWGETERERER